jgi:asparagine synthetase B (glutamine-hydrolysing)
MRAAERAGAIPVVHRFSGNEIREHVDRYLYQYEEIGGLYGIASWLLYRAMRSDGIRVSLDGHGGDELLAGYGLHVLLALLRGPSFASAPARAGDLINTLQQMYAPGDPDRPGSKAALAALTFPSVRALARRLLTSQRTLDESLRRHSAEPSSPDREVLERLGPLTGVLTTASIVNRSREYSATSMRTPWATGWRCGCRSSTGGWSVTPSPLQTRAR